MQTMPKLLGLSLALLASAATLARPAGDNPPAVDAQGVLRWQDGAEVNLFGVNYYPAFAYWDTAIRNAGADHYETMRHDVEHFRRLGLDCLRIHCFDRQISDRDGHLVDPDGHLEKLDYLIALCATSGIKVVLTPMAHWGAGGRPQDLAGFSNFHKYHELVDDERLWEVQARFLKEFGEHVNAYNGLRYADDPAIPAFELVNEPAYPQGCPVEKIRRYINTLSDALRSTGTRKPFFYIAWRTAGPGDAAALEGARVDGVTMGAYPGGINLGRERRGNILGTIPGEPIFAKCERHIAGKARMIYEFDTADTRESCLYPVMARQFRVSKAQIAAQFEYDPLAIADTNAGLSTHYLNLVYTPAKALSLAIAREVFRLVPMGAAPFEKRSDAHVFGPFRADSARNLSEMVTERDYIYTNDPVTPPPSPGKLERVWGCGSSPVVRSNGSGCYFLDRIAPGEWRLQVYPNIVDVDDPFARRKGVKVSVAKGDVTIKISLPDLGAPFTVTLAPGDWKVLKGGRVEPADYADGPRYFAPPPPDEPPPRVKPPHEARNMAELAAGRPWNFLDVESVTGNLMYRQKMSRTRDDEGRIAFRLESESFLEHPTEAVRSPCDGEAYARAVPGAGPGEVFVFRIRSTRPAMTSVQFLFSQTDGRMWGCYVPLAPEWREVRVPACDFTYMRHKPGVAPQGDAKAPDARLAESVSFVFGRWMYPDSVAEPHGFEVSFVGVEQSGWVPLSTRSGIVPGSAADLSGFCTYGPDAKRFAGVNVILDANTPANARDEVAFFRRAGWNSLRIHQHEESIASADGKGFDREKMRKFDELVAECAAQGMTLFTDLYVIRRRPPFKALGIDRPGTPQLQEYKELVTTNEAAFADYLAWAKAFMTHVNPFTGRDLAHEPALRFLCLINEGNVGNFKRERPEGWERIAADNERRFFRRMKRILREEIGYKGMLGNLNGWTYPDAYWPVIAEEYDFMDRHTYWDHPIYIGKKHSLPSRMAGAHPVFGWRILEKIEERRRTDRRFEDMPLTVSEWSGSAPGHCRGLASVSMGAFAGSRGWCGVWHYCWGSYAKGNDTAYAPGQPERPLSYWDLSRDPLAFAAERAVTAFLGRGDADASTVRLEDPKGSKVSIATARTCACYAKDGSCKAGAMECSDFDGEATVFATSLDGLPLATSRRILVTHLTDLQNTGICFRDKDRKILEAWGGLPYRVRRGRCTVSLAAACGEWKAYRLETDGSRRNEIPLRHAPGGLSFVADIAGDAANATIMYELARQEK